MWYWEILCRIIIGLEVGEFLEGMLVGPKLSDGSLVFAFGEDSDSSRSFKSQLGGVWLYILKL